MTGDSLLGAVLDNRYRVDERLGDGGMGEVFRATQVSLDRPVAVKVLRADVALQEEMRQRFEREAKVLSKLDHPGIVRVVDYGIHEQRPYLVMEFVEGETLGRRMKGGAGLPPKETIGILRELCEALSHAHEVGIVHRDLKPDNIVIDPDGHARILDFGIARMYDDEKATHLTSEGIVVGTPEYLSPEQATGQPIDPRTDLYSLGVIAYRMLSGQTPFRCNSAGEYLAAHVTRNPPPLVEHAPVSRELADIVHRLLEKHPASRFPSALATRDALDALDERTQSTQLGMPRVPDPAASTPTLETRQALPTPSAPKPTRALERDTANLTLLFTEVATYAERIGKLSFEAMEAFSKRHDALLDPVVSASGGRKVKSVQGTGLFTFPSPTSAVHAAAAIIDRLAVYNDLCEPDDRIEVSAGLNLGEVRVEGGDVFGEPVNIAARVKAIAVPGEVLLSGAVYLSMNRTECPTEPVGERTLKGIPEPVMIHRVAGTGGPLPFGGVALAKLRLPAPTPDTLGTSRWVTGSIRIRKGGVSLLGRIFSARNIGVGVVLALLLTGGALVERWAGGGSSVADTGRALLAAGKVDDAIDVLEAQAVVTQEPDDLAALHAALGLALTHGNRRGAAVEEFSTAAGYDPDALTDDDVAALAGLLSTAGRRSRQAEDTLVAVGRRARGPLEEIFEDESRGLYLRRRAGQVLHRLGENPDLVPLWIETLQSEHCRARKLAIAELAESADSRAEEPLRKLAEGDGGLFARFACGRQDAKEALEQLGF